MPTINITDNSHKMIEARKEKDSLADKLLVAYAKLQLNVLSTNEKGWHSDSLRILEGQIDTFKTSCEELRKAQDRIVVLMAIGGDRFDRSVPSPSELTRGSDNTLDDELPPTAYPHTIVQDTVGSGTKLVFSETAPMKY